jgi:hypothetical protein
MNDTSRWWWAVAAVLIAIAVGGYVVWQQMEAEPPAPPAPPRTEAPPAPAPVPAEPQIRHPIEDARPQPQEPTPLPSLGASDKFVQEALVGLLGAEPVKRFVIVDDFVRRVVSTVDNLPRNRAPVRLWPVQPTAGRFVASGAGSDAALSPSNDRRYAPFVELAEKVDTDAAVALYVRLYPLFQRAYEQLGYPNKHFNDRLVEVIDHLLATPAVGGPIELIAPEIKGPLKPEKPWTFYRYADPALESRSAGQKILIRMGAENAARLKAKLREVRARVTGGAVK